MVLRWHEPHQAGALHQAGVLHQAQAVHRRHALVGRLHPQLVRRHPGHVRVGALRRQAAARAAAVVGDAAT